MKKTIRDFDLDGKKVIIRCDFNVPIKNGIIQDDNRIKESLKTIMYAIENNAKVILLSHLGRVKTEEDLKTKTLYPVAVRLSELLDMDVAFINETRGKKLEETVNNMKEKEIVLIENTRFEDLDGNKESTNNEELGKYWASLGEIFINDAFGTCHRSHASNVGIASILPSGLGFLVEKELIEFDKIKNPERPFTVIMGGAKVKDKIKIIEELVKKADHLLIGGGMAYTFLKASGKEVGSSLLDEESIEFCKKMLLEYNEKILLPVDSICSLEISEESKAYCRNVGEYQKEDIGLDIGKKTIEKFKNVISISRTVVWNGPVGMSEYKQFSNGTIEICEALKEMNGVKIVGGGDSAAAVIKFGYKDYMTHVSTGGGAFLELIEGKKLPGIEIIDER